MCAYWEADERWRRRMERYKYMKGCVKHKTDYQGSCGRCNHEKYLQRFEPQMKEEEERRRKLNHAFQEAEKHASEKCSSCDKTIDFYEWFCYCSLCPDCYLKSDEEIDNYLGEPKPA